MSHDLNELAELAGHAADAVVGALADPDVRSDLGIETKTTTTDMVTVMDRWSEQTIVETILAARPDDGIVGEEGAERESTSGVSWIIDPIDGTTNFIRNLPGFSVSIAAAIDGVTVVGLVHDPIRNERFLAVTGQGATLNGETLKVSQPESLAKSVIATGFSYDPQRRLKQAEQLITVLPNVADIRRFGGAAIDCCSVAAGRLDAYFEIGVQDWDIAAGALLIKEAGGVVADQRDAGGPFIAASPAIFDDLVSLVGQATPS